MSKRVERFVSRDSWGARRARSRSKMVASAPETLHYYGPALGNVASPAAERSVVRSIQNFHMDKRGWADIAYNYLVGGSGYVYEGRGRLYRSAANGTSRANRSSTAIMLLVGEGEEVSSEMVSGVNWILGVLGSDKVVPHSYHKKTSCPGDLVRSMIRKGVLGASLAEGVGPVQDDQPSGSPLILSVGSRGERVKLLQRWLKELFLFDIDVDGVFGPQTKEFLKEAQRKLGVPELRVDGVFGPVTARKMLELRAVVAKLKDF